jgi:hypothetical protein
MGETAIAERKFVIGTDGKHHVVVRIYAPFKDGSDCRCSYEILDTDQLLRRSYAVGIDSLQALILAVQKMGADVTFLDYAKEKRLFWNEQNDDLGLLLPKIAPPQP